MGFSAEEAERRIAGFRQQSDGGLNVNYPLWEGPGDLTSVGIPMRERVQALYDIKNMGPLPTPDASSGVVDTAHLAMLRDTKFEAVRFHFGLPDWDTIQAIKAAGIFILCSATTVAGARTLEANGVDCVIAQGSEAGGHRGTFSGVGTGMQSDLFALLPQVVDAVDVPVVAAG